MVKVVEHAAKCMHPLSIQLLLDFNLLLRLVYQLAQLEEGYKFAPCFIFHKVLAVFYSFFGSMLALVAT